jgi:hypothetical protein
LFGIDRVFSSYRLNQHIFPSLGLYSKFNLHRIPVFSRFSLDRFHCAIFMFFAKNLCVFFSSSKTSKLNIVHVHMVLNETNYSTSLHVYLWNYLLIVYSICEPLLLSSENCGKILSLVLFLLLYYMHCNEKHKIMEYYV